MLVKVLIFPYYKLMVNVNKEDNRMVEEIQVTPEEVEPQKKSGPFNFSDAMKEALAMLEAQETSGEKSQGAKHLGKVIQLLQGKRIKSELIHITDDVTIKLASLTGRHQTLIADMCIDKEKTDDDGKPVYNERLSYNMTLALMLVELNGLEIVDPFAKDSGFEQLWEEIDSRSNTFNDWPPAWLQALSKAAEDFTYDLAEATSENNVKDF